MLNLPVAMLKDILLVFASFFWLSPFAAQSSPVQITSPQAGQVLRGNVNISGTLPADQFSSAELSYAYSGQDTASWFLVAEIPQPISDGVLASWDTSTISDGDYKLKLTVKHTDGTSQDTIIDPVLVRNYTAVQSTPTVFPTETAAATQLAILQTETLFAASPTLAPTQVVSVTPFPSNPASLSEEQLTGSLKDGLVLGGLIMAVVGIYAYFRYLRFHR
jgi:hypothetical protein